MFISIFLPLKKIILEKENETYLDFDVQEAL